MSTFHSPSDPLPQGTTVLEASAGTGKTYTIAALAARFLAEGAVTVHDLLLVTFSRSATAELRLRVRERLRDTARDLAAAADGVRPDDPVSALLADADADEVARRARRLDDAHRSFDRAAIMTTHEFCHGMLAGLGVLAPQTPQSTLVEDLRPLADEVAEDVFVRMFADEPHGAPFPFARDWRADPAARTIAREVVHEVADLTGHGTPGAAGARVEFGVQVRAEVEKRKQARRLYSFDDQLRHLDDALGDPATGDLARARLADRFKVVLVDEFQDTDPVQWSVLRRAFDGAATLVLIGDPKQAIYGFRGGDVHTYSLAVKAAGTRTTLGTNHRSDPAVVDAVHALFAGVALGDDIVAPPVSAARESRVVADPGTGWQGGVQIRVLESPEPVPAPQATRGITRDLVGVVGGLLGPEPALRRPDGTGLNPREIAVLVRSNKRGHQLAAELARAGIPATFTGSRTVFDSDAAGDWLTLLRALDQPRRPYLQRAWLTDFVGATVRDLAQADDDQRSRWSLLVHTWARVLERSGVPALVATIDADTDLTARMLGRADGERWVTDHRHLAELLHTHRLATPHARARELAAWLDAASDGASGAAATQRRDTDADAVQVMTIHRAKGLQWPVVLLPEASHTFAFGPGDPTRDTGGKLVLPTGDGRMLDIAGRGAPARADRWQRWLAEDGDEALRALYVGLTRAESRVVTWWAHHTEVDAAPLHRLLHARHDAGAPERVRAAQPTDDLEAGGSPLRLGWLAGGPVTVVRAEPDAPRPDPRPAERPRLSGRAWTRAIDHDWRRTSYSGLTAAEHDRGPATDTPLVADEGAPVAVDSDPRWADPSPMADLPGGAAFGTLVHAVYEHTDATGEAWRASLATAFAEALRRWPVGDVAADALTEALIPSFETPLGPLAPGVRLVDLPKADRLAELDFEFALDDPGSTRAASTLADVADLMTQHLPPDDPLATYPARLGQPGLAEQTLRGFLTGSIDGVFRLDGHTPDGGYLVVDYKTNRLAGVDEPLTLGHYTPDAMAEAMMASHYPLQALLYCVALHRFLRLRLAGYDPHRHLAGVAYLFVRGMAGAQTPTVDGHPLGVFAWRPPVALIEAVSRLLAGGAS